MTSEPSAMRSFENLLIQGQQLHSQLVALHEGMAQELADQKTELSQTLARQGQLQDELEVLRSARQQWTAERERLMKEGERLRKEHENLNQILAGLRNDLHRLSDDRDQLLREHEEHERRVAQLAETEATLAQGRVQMEALREQLRQDQERWEAERQTLLAKHETEAKGLRERLAALSAENEALQAYQLQWAVDREGYLKSSQLAAAQQADLEQELQESGLKLLEEKMTHEARLAGLEEQLRAKEAKFTAEVGRMQSRLEEAQAGMQLSEQLKRAAQEECEQLKELHAQVTEQASRLAAEWSARRQALAAENQQLRVEVERTRTTLDLSQQREKQWQVQVRKLQDDVTKLGDAVGRVTLTDEQSYQLHSQLNAIVGFAEVLLDEAGNRATAAEHQEYLQHIKDSGARLAGYVHQLTMAPKDGSIPAEAAGAQIPLGPPAFRSAAPTVLVADTDAAVRDRIEAFLSGAGYQVEFASDTEEALKTAARLQPLAIMIDAALPPNGAMGLVDVLLREPRTRDIPVVLTVRDNQEQLGLNIGHYDFLTKPIDQQQVLQMMVKYDLLGERRRANKMPASVLVVDDDRRNTRLVEAMLKPFKIEVLVADGGAAGIKLAFERKPDLVILDLMMPQVDGFEVVSALRKDSATSQIPILIYTAKKITSDDRRRLQGSIQSIIRKGEFSKEEFLELVYKRGERRNRPSAAETAA